MKKSKKKKYKASKKTWIILSIFIITVVSIIVFFVYINSEKYQRRKVENKIEELAEEYYTEKLSKVASEYIKTKAQRGESITINIDALKKYGKDTSELKNIKTGEQCNDIDSYVVIKIKENANDISKDYEVQEIVLDCFN